MWEWRGGSSGYVPGATGNDALFFIGSTSPTTIRIRYQSALTQFASLQFTITGWSAAGTDITFNAVNSLSAGKTVQLAGFVNSTFFNGLKVTVTSATGTAFHATISGTSGVTDQGFGLPTFNYPILYASTFVPVADCEEALAYNTAYKIALAISGPNPGVQELKAQYLESMRQLKNEYVRRAQTIEYNRQGYGGDGANQDGYYGSSDNLI